MKTLEQRRASYAYTRLEQVYGQYDSAGEDNKKAASEKKRVAPYLYRLPAMLLTNGLGHTLAFLQSKGSDEQWDAEYVAFDIVAEWLVEHRELYAGPRREIVKRMMEGSRHTYRLATQETWALLAWLKNFAQKHGGAADANIS